MGVDGIPYKVEQPPASPLAFLRFILDRKRRVLLVNTPYGVGKVDMFPVKR